MSRTVRILRALAVASLATAFYGIILPAMLAIGLVKRCVGLALFACQRGRRSGEYDWHKAKPLATHDAMFLYDVPTQRHIVNAVLVLGGPPLELTRLAQLVTQRVLSHPALGRFLCLLVPDAASLTGHSWVPDPRFDVGRHLAAVPADEAPRTETALQAWLSRVVSDPLPSDRPLWSLHLIDRFGADGGSALVFRCHHVVGDGIVMSGILLEQLMDPKAPDATAEGSERIGGIGGGGGAGGGGDGGGGAGRDASPACRPAATAAAAGSAASQRARRREMGWRGRLLAALRLLRDTVELPFALSSMLLRSDDRNALHAVWELTGIKRIAWSRTTPLAAVKAVKQDCGGGCTVNDVLMTAALAATSRYLDERTAAITAIDASPVLPSSLCAQLRAAAEAEVVLGVPFNVRSRAEMQRVVLENKFAVIMTPFPLRASSRHERLAATTRAMLRVKAGPLPMTMWASLQAVQRLLPACAARWCIDAVADGATALVTNNRGPATALHLDGRCCVYWVSWAPQRASIGLCITVFTYAGHVRCSVSADTSCVPEPDRLVELFSSELDALIGLAGWGGEVAEPQQMDQLGRQGGAADGTAEPRRELALAGRAGPIGVHTHGCSEPQEDSEEDISAPAGSAARRPLISRARLTE